MGSYSREDDVVLFPIYIQDSTTNPSMATIKIESQKSAYSRPPFYEKFMMGFVQVRSRNYKRSMACPSLLSWICTPQFLPYYIQNSAISQHICSINNKCVTLIESKQNCSNIVREKTTITKVNDLWELLPIILIFGWTESSTGPWSSLNSYQQWFWDINHQ